MESRAREFRVKLMRCAPAAILGAVFLFSSCLADEGKKLTDPKERESYSFGYQFGETIKRQGMEINMDVYTSGIKDALEGKAPLMSQEEIRATLMEAQKRAAAARQAEQKKKAEENLAAGKAFLEENKKKEGVTVLPSGLQYKVLKEGAGKTPKSSDMVTVQYKGTHIDGTEFDSSYKRNEPAKFAVDKVIKGWTEALQLMKEGSKWQLYIPPELGYGERGTRGIGPNSALIFEVELLSVGTSGKTPTGSPQ